MTCHPIIDFIEARLAEDESAALAATSGPWGHDPSKAWLEPAAFERYDTSKGEAYVSFGGPSPFTGCIAVTGPTTDQSSVANADHIARHDPARVLREVAAKRALLADFADELRDAERHEDVDMLEAYTRLLGVLAAAYSDHPDYDQSWSTA